MAFRRKQRDLNEAQHDPDFIFYVGRLVGASEVTSYWLRMQTDNPEFAEMGQRLGAVVKWFLDSPEEPVTKILPPPKPHDYQS